MKESLLRLARCAAYCAVLTLAACGGNVVPRLVHVGGTVSGLAGGSVVLQNNGGADLPVAANGSFAFPVAAQGTPYAVTVKLQPTMPVQVCTVSHGSGVLGADDVDDVAVNCVRPSEPGYSIGGTVSGLTGAPVLLQDNGGDDLSVSADGTFVFPTSLPNNAGYAVTIKAQPNVPLQTCTVNNGTGTVNGANVGSIDVRCTTLTTHTIGGTATGLLSGLVLSDGVDLAVAADGSFTFPGTVVEGTSYAVVIKSYPGAPAQTCSISNGSGIVGKNDVTDVRVDCQAPPPAPTYALGGSVSGLQGSGLVLQDTVSGRTLGVAANGAFTFGPRLTAGAAYALVVQAQPVIPGQVCTVANGSGAIGTADVTNIAVTCPAPPHFLFSSGLSATQGFAVDAATGALTATGNSVPVGGTLRASIAANRFLYQTSLGAQTVRGYAIDPQSGVLSELPGSPYATGGSGPTATTATPDGKFLYVANRDSNTVSTFAVDASTGSLTPVGQPVATGSWPAILVVTPNGKFLYVANYVGNSISTYALDPASGVPTPMFQTTAVSPRLVTIDPTGHFLYYTTGISSDHALYGYAIDGTTGGLTAIPGMPVTPGTGPQSVTIDPLGRYLYASVESDGTVASFAIAAGTGALTPIGTPVAVGQYPEGITMDPNGRFVYVAVQGGNTVAILKPDPATGLLTPAGTAATTLPFGIAISGGK